jgi:hypothetical protein
MAHEYVHDNQTVRLTGRFAVQVSHLSPAIRALSTQIANIIQVEIRNTDPDLKSTMWVKYVELAEIGDVRSAG